MEWFVLLFQIFPILGFLYIYKWIKDGHVIVPLGRLTVFGSFKKITREDNTIGFWLTVLVNLLLVFCFSLLLLAFAIYPPFY